MAALAPGALMKLLDGMKAGAAKPVGEHRTAVLQVTDIMPVDLDEKDLWPKHGFYIKVSDSSHSVYVSLPLGQDDLVLSNKMQLGQFIHVDRLESASPVPVIVGVRPIPGRHPMVGTPEPLTRAKQASHFASASRRRGSWEPDTGPAASVASPMVVKPTALDFGEKTPVKDRLRIIPMSPARSGRPGKEASSALVRKSCVISKFSRSRSVSERDPKENSVASTPKLRSAARVEDSCPPSNEHGSSGNHIHLPGKLSMLGKEAVQLKETAQKAALKALRDATATENVVRILKMFSKLSRSARPDSPASCFDCFLSFHQETVQALIDMETIQAATSMAAASEETADTREPDDPPILQERIYNSISQCGKSSTVSSSKRRALAVSKSVSFTPETNDATSKSRSSSAAQKMTSLEKNWQDNKMIRLMKEIQSEAGQWFMEFIEAALDSGLKKAKGSRGCCCPQSLILRVINWLEIEQGDSSKRPIHPRYAQIARKLRIKAKNP